MEAVCRECGKVFEGRKNKSGNWISPWKQLAGHIMRSEDHKNKKWAGEFLRKEKIDV